MKKLLCTILAGLAALSTISGCAKSDTKPTAKENSESPKDVKLTFMTNIVGEQANVLEQVINEFQKTTGYVVEFSAPGKSYEELMKTKMSSNELPDLFTTHGWSVARYSEYLEPVNDMPFAKDISDQLKPVITDKEGKMFVLPMDRDIAGIIYNVDVVKEAGVNVDEIKTWTDFEEACKKVKEKGISPIHMGGKDNWTIGQFGDWAAPSIFVTNEKDNKKDELKSGKFDPKTWEKVAGLMDKWVKAGYFNKDALTSDYNSDMEAIATNKAAFEFYGNSSIVDAKKINEKANLGMMPIPANSKDDEPSLIAGERIAVGVWKDSPQKEAAIELLNYLAKPEVMSKVATSSGNPAGLDGVKSDIGDINKYYEKYKNVKTYPYFDREYLPSGMWDVMCATGADVLSGKENAVVNAGKVMEQNFNDKFSQK